MKSQSNAHLYRAQKPEVFRAINNTHSIVVIPENESRWLRTMPDDAGEVDGASAIDEKLGPANYLCVWL